MTIQSAPNKPYRYDSAERRIIRARFRVEGISISQWAMEHGFNPLMTYRVLSGEVKGERGEAHRIAVALGLKSQPKNLRFRAVA